MSAFVVPLAMGTLGVILIVGVILLIGAVGYALLTQDNPREVAVEAEHERVAAEGDMREPFDFEGDLKPPPDAAP
jgi:hypothetical protein